MKSPGQDSWKRDLGSLAVLGLAFLALHCLTNHQYGFHRDELATLDDARHLDWGYVAYPPLTPAFGRLSLELFGTSLVGFRFFAALAASVALILTGLIARELGGSRWAQLVAALAAAIAPLALSMGALFQYVAFDFLWWVLLSFLLVRLLKQDRARDWLVVGAVVGIGMLTKYTMGFFALAVAAAVVLTPARRHLRSGWLWGGVALALLIFLPNLIWQAQHDFISLEFLKRIHTRDVAIGRAAGFFSQQFYVNTSIVTLPLWLAGIHYYGWSERGRPFRLLGWAFLFVLVFFAVVRARFYYLAPAYPMLLAAGAVVWETRLAALPSGWARTGRLATWAVLLAGLALAAPIALPIVPIDSRWWPRVASVNDDFAEEVGWPELVSQIAAIYEEQRQAGSTGIAILTANYGEAGAINLYGPALKLPAAMSGVNSLWARGYGEIPPEVVIVVGFSRARAERYFFDCKPAGQVTNRFGVKNEETSDNPEIFICRRPRMPWPILWQKLRSFG